MSISLFGKSLTGFPDYIGNEQETQRNPSVNDEGEIIEAVSSNIDDRTMHEV
jgi:beta-glucosidase